jgi:membrane protein
MKADFTKRMVEELKLRLYVALLFLQYAGRRFLRDRCPEASASLAFATLLALLPVTFIGLSVLSAFPVFDHFLVGLREFVVENFASEARVGVTEYLDWFTRETGRTTTFGLIGLGVTTLILLLNIEAAFNAIWRVTERRSLVWRMVAFWAVLTMGPMLLGVSLSVSGPMVTGQQLSGLGRLVAPVVEFVALTVIYTIIPNRPVKMRHALAGAGVAALLLEVLRIMVAAFVFPLPAILTVYGALAAFPAFLAILFTGWFAALVGAVVAASLAEWGARSEVLGRPHLSPGNRLVVALALLAELQTASRLGGVRRRRDLLRNLDLGAFVVEAVLDELVKAKYVARVGRDQWVLTRDLEHASVYDLYYDLKLGVGTDPFRWLKGAPWQSRAREMISSFDDFGLESMGTSLKDLFASEESNQERTTEPDGTG